MMTTADAAPYLEHIADSVIARSHGVAEPALIRQMVVEVAAEFDVVTIRDFLPVLIAKEVNDRLRRL